MANSLDPVSHDVTSPGLNVPPGEVNPGDLIKYQPIGQTVKTYDTGPYTVNQTVPIRGVGTLQQQTNAALQNQPQVNRTPTFIKDTGQASTQTGQYLDKWGRVAVGRLDANGSIIVKDTAPPPPIPTPPPTPKPINPLPPTPYNPGSIDGDPHANNLKQDPTTTLNLSSVAGLIGVGRLANGTWNLIHSGNPDSMANTGAFAGIENGIDAWGNSIAPTAFAPSTGAFTGGAGWTWNPESQYFELTDPGALGANVGDTTLTNAIGYGNFGSFVANILGLSTGSFIGDLAAGTIGGAVGGFVGGEIGGTLLGIGAGALGAFVGGFALTAIISAFGPRPSDMLAGGMWDSNTSSMLNTWTYQGQKYSTTNNKNRDDFFNYVGTLQTNIAKTFGLEADQVSVGRIRLDLGRYTGVAVNIGDQVGWGDQDTGKDFGDGQKALEYVGKTMLQKMRDTDADTRYVQNSMDWEHTSFDQATGKLAFAHDFSKTSQNFITGNFTIDQNKEDSLATIDSWAAQAHSLFTGDKSDDYAATIDRAVTAAKQKVFQNFQNM